MKKYFLILGIIFLVTTILHSHNGIQEKNERKNAYVTVIHGGVFLNSDLTCHMDFYSGLISYSGDTVVNGKLTFCGNFDYESLWAIDVR